MEQLVEDRHSLADNEVSLSKQKHYGVQEETDRNEANQHQTGEFFPNPPENPASPLPKPQIDNRPAIHLPENKSNNQLQPFLTLDDNAVPFVLYLLDPYWKNISFDKPDITEIDARLFLHLKLLLPNTFAYKKFKKGVFELIWLSELGNRFGHAALVMLDPWCYISFWPGNEGKIWIRGPGVPSQSFENDMREEGGPPNCIYYTESLDTIQIREYRENNGYNAFTNNCCHVVFKALLAGGAKECTITSYFCFPIFLNCYCEKYYQKLFASEQNPY